MLPVLVQNDEIPDRGLSRNSFRKKGFQASQKGKIKQVFRVQLP